MKILHTSDWHLGRLLYKHKRYDEFEQFLDWLLTTLNQDKIDILLIAGDIFDTTTPSHRAQALYYRFLASVSQSYCRHVVIIAGNHDSPSLLNAPKGLLAALNVHVVGSISDTVEDEVIELCNDNQETEAIICAVPYLRDRDIRQSTAGETVEDKNTQLIRGIQQHYAAVYQYAEQQRAGRDIPLIAMGHLFTVGGKVKENDGTRDLYVGSLAHVESDIFSPNIDYLALGHLHVPQIVGGKTHYRYSGSPLAMSFGEAKQKKSVVIITSQGRELAIDLKPIPCFQVLESIKGDSQAIQKRIDVLKAENSQAWLDIEYTGEAIAPELRQQVEEQLEGSQMLLCRLRNRRLIERCLTPIEQEALEELNEQDVFERCLNSHEVQNDERDQLKRLYSEVINNLQMEDTLAE